MGLCSLLLGETERAMMDLGLRPGSNKPPDKDVVAFVKENSPSEDDLLPGLCALAEVWLKETILPNYKEINMMTSSLGEWFQSPRVSVYLKVRRGRRSSAFQKISVAFDSGFGTGEGFEYHLGSEVEHLRRSRHLFCRFSDSRRTEERFSETAIQRSVRFGARWAIEAAKSRYHTIVSERNSCGDLRLGRAHLHG